jgi:hypothetical protein
MKKVKTLRFLVATSLALVAGGQDATAQTWSGTSAPTDVNWVSVASSADGTKLVAAGGYPTWSVYVSANSGASWTETTQNIGFGCVACSADGTKVVGVQNNNDYVFTSTNSGVTFAQTSAPQCYWLFLTSSADGTKLAAVGQTGQPGPIQIYTSSDSGNTWRLTSAPPAGWDGLASSADGTRLVADTGGNGWFYTSTDSGAHWTQQTNEPNIWWGPVASSADGMKLAAAALGGGIYTSTNSGTNWMQQTNAPIEYWNAIASCADGTKLVAAANPSGFGITTPGPIYTSSDSGVTWVSNNVPGEFWMAVASSADGSSLVACSSAGTTTTNGYTALDQIVTSTPHPWLTPVLVQTNVVITWPWPMAGYQLQQIPDLSTTHWTDVTNAPVATNLHYQVMVSPMAGEGYYRLKN